MIVNKPAILVLDDGCCFEGISIGAQGFGVGELVFNTSMTGYQEILSDPSYAQQIVTLTAAQVGNTGCNYEDLESSRAWAAGLVIRNASLIPSNYRAKQSLSAWLIQQGVVAIAGIDTRQLTLYLREKGAVHACICTDPALKETALKKAQSFAGLHNKDLAIEVSRSTIERWHEGRGAFALSSAPAAFHVVAYDFGVKHQLLRILYDKGCHVTLVPASTSAAEVLAMQPDGIFLSNGPGDPGACSYAIEATQTFLEKGIPLLGICLGFQIMALAAGASSLKMKFGHHGANHPVCAYDADNRPLGVSITSQNHGFAIDEASLPPEYQVTHRSLFDNSLQGIKHREKPALGFQGHPEASPGPHDMESLFDEFIHFMKEKSFHSKKNVS